MAKTLGTVFRGKLNPDRLRQALGAAACVEERTRFLAAELRGRPATGRYHLRDTSLSIEVRHPLLDAWVVAEVFGRNVYEPVEPVRRSLPQGRPLRVLDLGGHIGSFGLFVMSRFPQAQITSYEPDPRNGSVLQRCIELNDLAERWTLIPAAAAVRDGEVTFQSSFHLSRVAEPDDLRLEKLHADLGTAIPYLAGSDLLRSRPEKVPCRDVLPAMGEADLVKIDIEGGEWDILRDPRFLPPSVRALVLEYHPPYLDVPDPLAFVLDRLHAAGLRTAHPPRGVDNGMIWAWRPAGLSA